MEGSKFERAVLDMEAYRIYLREVHKSAITTINYWTDGYGVLGPHIKKTNKNKNSRRMLGLFVTRGWSTNATTA